MPEIDLGQVTPPYGEPDLLSFGDEPGGADRLDLAGEGSDPADQRRPRWLPAWWRDRPVPRSVVAVVSALVAGAAVAVYLEPQSGARSDPPPEPARLLAPESWLDVADMPRSVPFETGRPEGPRIDAAVAAHPTAALVVPIGGYASQLVALPPGSYRVLVSCQLAAPLESIPESVSFELTLREGGDRGRDAVELTCDGGLQTVHERFSVPDYLALTVEFFPVFFESDENPSAAIDAAQPVAVVSFTPG